MKRHCKKRIPPAAIIAATMMIGLGSALSTGPALAVSDSPSAPQDSALDKSPVSLLDRFRQRLQQLDQRGSGNGGMFNHDTARPGAVVPDTNQPTLAPVQMAQSSDAAFRVIELEEQVRSLNGKLEEMTFQLLQLQEQIRRMQEDNEFRFQELEDQSALKKKNRNTAKAGGESLGKLQPSESETASNNAGSIDSDGIVDRKSIEELLEGDGGSPLGTPPQALGTLTFDENGNLIDSNVGKPIDLTGQLRVPQGMPESEDELFKLGYEYVQGGDYDQAGDVFQQYVDQFPGSSRDAEARFWLGESLFAQGDYEASARVFLENHRTNPQGPLAAQNLLKLGVSLSGLQQRELACATLAEVPWKYPGMSNSVRKRVIVEQQAAKCQSG